MVCRKMVFILHTLVVCRHESHSTFSLRMWPTRWTWAISKVSWLRFFHKPCWDIHLSKINIFKLPSLKCCTKSFIIFIQSVNIDSTIITNSDAQAKGHQWDSTSNRTTTTHYGQIWWFVLVMRGRCHCRQLIPSTCILVVMLLCATSEAAQSIYYLLKRARSICTWLALF